MRLSKVKKSRSCKSAAARRDHQIICRLDESLPLETEDWRPVEKLLAYLTEFAPTSLICDLGTAIASFADDQARRGYILGQEDLARQKQDKVA